MRRYHSNTQEEADEEGEGLPAAAVVGRQWGDAVAEASRRRSKKSDVSSSVGGPARDGRRGKSKSREEGSKSSTRQTKKRVGIDSVPQLDSTRLAQESDPFRDGNGEFPIGELLTALKHAKPYTASNSIIVAFPQDEYLGFVNPGP
jgi:hypothetical protein